MLSATHQEPGTSIRAHSNCRHWHTACPRACLKPRCRRQPLRSQACVWRSLRKAINKPGSTSSSPSLPSVLLAARRLPAVIVCATATASKDTTQPARSPPAAPTTREARPDTGAWLNVKRRPHRRSSKAPASLQPSTGVLEPPAQRPASWWTRYLEQLHQTTDLDAILTLAEHAWPDVSSPAAPVPHKTAAAPPDPAAPVVHWRDVPLQQRNEASAAVDTLELLAARLKGLAGGSTAQEQEEEEPGGDGQGDATQALRSLQEGLVADEGGGRPGEAGASGAGQQQHSSTEPTSPVRLSSHLLVRCQVVVWRCLCALQPLLLSSALRPKHLASLARAINTLAAASPATNTRQLHPSSPGFLISTTTPPPRQQQQGSVTAAQPAVPTNIGNTPSSSSDGAPPSTGAAPAQGPSRPELSSPGPAAPSLYVLAKLPAGWAQAYSSAVTSALPTCSPASLVYLLRALSLDRGKRILRAALLLSPHVSSRVGELAAQMSSAQIAVCLSCAAQLVWDPQGRWYESLITGLDSCCQAEGGRIPPDQAAAILHALACLRSSPPHNTAMRLFTSMATALPVAPSQAGGSTQASEPLTPGQGPSKPLSALQLSSSLWAAARLQLRPPELWLRAHMIATFKLLKAGEFRPPQLASMLWALGKLGWGPSPVWLAAFFSHLTAQLPDMRPGELGIVMWALSKIEYQPTKELLDAIARASARHAAHLDMRQVSMLYVSWARLEYKPGGLQHQAILRRLADLTAQHTAHSTAGTQAGKAVRQQAGRAGGSGVPGTSLQAIANIVWALHLMPFKRRWSAVVLSLAELCCHNMDRFNLVELGMLGRGLGVLLDKATQATGDAGTPGSSQGQEQAQDNTEQAEDKLKAVGPRDTELYSTYLTATQRQLQRIHRQGVSSPQQQAGPRSSSGASAEPTQLPEVLRQAGGVPQGYLAERGAGHVWSGLPFQCAAVLEGAVVLGGNMQPPEAWMNTFYQATQGSLRVWGVPELKVLVAPLPRMQPPPTPPLPWVKAFIDRRDQLSVQSSTPKELKQQMLLAQRIMRRAWQAKTGQEAAWVGTAGGTTGAEQQEGGVALSRLAPGEGDAGRPKPRKSNKSRRAAGRVVGAAGPEAVRMR